MEVNAISDFWGTKRLQAPQGSGSTEAVFRASVKAPKTKSSAASTVSFSIGKSPLYVLEAGPLVRLAQVAASDADDLLASQRLAAFAAQEQGDTTSALDAWKKVCADPQAMEQDYLWLADAAQVLREYSVAAEAFGKAVALAKDSERDDLIARHARALTLSGQAAQAISSYASLAIPKDSKQRPKTESPTLLAALGQAYLAAGDLNGAERVGELLRDVSDDLPLDAIRFRAALRLAAASSAAAKAPKDADRLAEYGRALLDNGRWEEALAPLRRALELNPRLHSVQSDIEYAKSRMLGELDNSVEPTDERLAEARQAVIIRDGSKERKTKDFQAWHRLAMLLYAKWDRLDAAGDAKASDFRSECTEALAEAVNCARSGARVDEGIYAPYVGYATSRTVAVAGYAYREAAADYLVLDSLQTLARDPTDRFARLKLAGALVDLRQTAAAKRALNAARDGWQGDPEFLYLEAMVAVQSGNTRNAVERLQQVIAHNPHHRSAYERLALLLTEEGDSVGTAAVLADYAEEFGGRLVVSGEPQ